MDDVKVAGRHRHRQFGRPAYFNDLQQAVVFNRVDRDIDLVGLQFTGNGFDVADRAVNALAKEPLADDLRVIVDETDQRKAKLRCLIKPGGNALTGTTGSDRQDMAGSGPYAIEPPMHRAEETHTHGCQRQPAAEDEEENVLAAVADQRHILDKEDREDLKDTQPEHPLADIGDLINTGRKDLVLVEMEFPEYRDGSQCGTGEKD
jgi:hypothetical protein